MHDVQMGPGEKADELARAIIGAAIEVHRTLGPGFLESAYEEALAIELTDRRTPFQRQVPIALQYKGRRIGESRLDFLVDQTVILKLKAVDSLAPIHTAQTLSYLKATGKRLGSLINFNVEVLKQGIKRVAL